MPSNSHSRRRSSHSHRRSSDAAPRLRVPDTSVDDAVKEASRAALRQAAQRRQERRHSGGGTRNAGGYYYSVPRTETPEIPSYETFLAEARARTRNSYVAESTYQVDPAPVTRQSQHGDYQYQNFDPNPYLYGYPSGYYQEIRAPLHHADSARTNKTARSSTLVGSGSDGSPSPYSSTLVPSARPSTDERSPLLRHAQPPAVQLRTSNPKRQTRVTWGPTSTCVESPQHVSTPHSTTPVNTNKPLPTPPTKRLTKHQSISTPSPSSSTTDVEDSPIHLINLSPSLFVGNKTYTNSAHGTTRRSRIQQNPSHAPREVENRNLSDGRNQRQNGQVGSVGVGEIGSRWSPDTSPEKAPLRRMLRNLSATRRKRRKKGSGPGGKG